MWILFVGLARLGPTNVTIPVLYLDKSPIRGNMCGIAAVRSLTGGG